MTIARRSKEKKRTRNIIVIRLIQLILIICMIWSLIHIINWFKDNKKSSQIKKQIDEAIVIDDGSEYKIDFDKLESTNNDVIGWIKVNNTNIEYPVVQTNNNDYYLNHSFDKSINSAGWIFADYKNKFDGTDKNIVIYGHNRKDQSMFGTLSNVLKKEWYEDENNRKLVLTTKHTEKIYEIFSAYQIQNEEYYIKTNFNNDNDFKEFINTIKSRSVYNFQVEVDENSKILTLSTCGASNKYRVAVHAKLIEN